MRKFLKLKKLPKPDIKKGVFPMLRNNIRLLGIGYKDDIDMKFESGITHEAL